MCLERKILCLFSVFAFSHCFVLEFDSSSKQSPLTSNVTSILMSPTAPILTVNDFLIEGDADYVVDTESVRDDFGTNVAEFDANNDGEYSDGRIVGGNAVSIRQFPYQISLQYNRAHICGGTIVAPNLIITAAHCVERPGNPSLYKVRAGSSQHKHGGQLLDVHRILRHELYSKQTLDNDVAIVVLAARLSFNQYVKAARVAKQTDAVPAKQRLFVSGWGTTTESGGVVPVLRYAAVRLLNDEFCKRSYKTFARITQQMFCAGVANGGRDSCQGDSGGPLVSYIRGAPTLFGVVSWGVGCAQKGFPGVYAKVSSLRPWINQKIIELRNTKILES